MTIDVLDPGPAGDFPHLPRNADGTLDTTRMPIGPHHQPGPDGRRVLIDVIPTVRTLDGRLVPVTDVVPVTGQ